MGIDIRYIYQLKTYLQIQRVFYLLILAKYVQSVLNTQLFATYVYSADSYGNNINAGKTGATIPVQARLYSLKEGEKEVDETLQCSGGSQLTCKKIVGTRQYGRI